MRKLSWLSAVMAITMLFFQCQKDISFTGGPDTGASVTPDPITASLQGNIMDENDQPAAGVMVTAGTSTTVTDASGYFRFTDASLDKNTTLVTAIKDGYFKGYRVFAATSGCNQVAIKLLKRDLAGTVAAATGGEVALANGSKVKLPADGVVTASSNSDYSGDVKVYASYINPGSSDIGRTIPGSLVANDRNGKRVVLQSYGMLAVELSSASGEKLQIKSGSAATLTIPIPSASVASAPATIPLWYVDETTGIWQEEGTATKQGNNYIGDVKHFSYWNCDYPYDATELSFTLQTSDGLPLVNAYVEVIPTDSTGGLSHGYTDSLGQVKGLVPANKNLQFRVYGPCSNIVYSQNISPVSKSSDLGIIKITDQTSSLVIITGNLLDCSNNKVSNGYALINFNGATRYVSVDSTGQFTTSYFLCSSAPGSADILGVNKDVQQQSNNTTVTITYPITDAGNITACGVSSEQYMNYTIDGTDSYSITSNANDSLTFGVTQSDSTFINATSQSNYVYFGSRGGAIIGTHFMTSISISPQFSYIVMGDPSTVTFTSYPAAAGEFYEGSFSSQFTDSVSTHNVTGSFRIRRSN